MDRDALGNPIIAFCALQDYVPHRTLHLDYLARFKDQLLREEWAYGLRVSTLALGRPFLTSRDSILRQPEAGQLLVPRPVDRPD